MPTCENCGGTDIDFDTSRGDAVCIQCGTVLEENTIVNEVTFAQDAGGGSSVVGQFVAATPGAASAGLGFSKESREVAYSNGQRHVSQLAAALRLAEHHQDPSPSPSPSPNPNPTPNPNPNQESYKDSTLIMQLLRDNLTLWTSEENE